MSPDIEWQITDENNPQTVVKTTEPKPPRWRALAVLVVVVLGIGLGFVYRSIPEPATPGANSDDRARSRIDRLAAGIIPSR